MFVNRVRQYRNGQPVVLRVKFSADQRVDINSRCSLRPTLSVEQFVSYVVLWQFLPGVKPNWFVLVCTSFSYECLECLRKTVQKTALVVFLLSAILQVRKETIIQRQPNLNILPTGRFGLVGCVSHLSEQKPS